ncbi:MAG: LytTR family transcriptional regulator DNA-binding domain-containing protein [Bacilli bacterium]|nr:LytTR family transcriptional regulator DNA-binding domain-containing protein [Bacilli bacterium]
MISFVICDDNKKINESIVNVVDKVMMKNQVPYKKYVYFDYDSRFHEIMARKIPNKIYILDIETPSASGIDMVRRIRETDMDSIIIFLTSHDELGYTILKQEFMFLSFICKFDNYEEKLESSVKKALKISGQKRILSLNDHGTIYNIPHDDILYITRDSVDRKCIVKTDYSEFRINRSLTELLEELGDDFKLSHRACIVNMERVRVVNKKKKIITFNTGQTTDLMNDDFKKEVEGNKKVEVR